MVFASKLFNISCFITIANFASVASLTTPIFDPRARASSSLPNVVGSIPATSQQKSRSEWLDDQHDQRESTRIASEFLRDALRSPEGKELAEMFDGSQCSQWKTIADLKHWARSMIERPDLDLKFSQEMFIYRKPNTSVVYVRNQKAASTYLVEELGDMLGGVQRARIYAPLKTVETLSRYHRPSLGEDPFVFTVVRDPIKTAVDAYLEVSKRIYGIPDPPPAFSGMPCGTVEEATSRFKQFLSEARSGEPVSSEFFHSYPQALKVDVGIDVSYTSILKLENFEAIMSVPGFDHLVPASDEDKHTRISPCGNLSFGDPELLDMLCDMYRVDFECFGYSLPSTCKN